MLEHVTMRNDLLAKEIIKGLESRNMSGYYVHTKEEAKELALSLIPKGATVSMGGSMSVGQIGLLDEVKGPDYNFLDRGAAEDKRAIELATYGADVYLGSTNAITNDGVLVNIDGNSNRVSAYAYGPKKVILIVGMNKVTGDIDSAVKRARNEAATMNTQRFGKKTPCTQTGKCMNCKSPDTICCNFLITRYERHKDRMHVILVNESLGF